MYEEHLLSIGVQAGPNEASSSMSNIRRRRTEKEEACVSGDNYMNQGGMEIQTRLMEIEFLLKIVAILLGILVVLMLVVLCKH